MEIVIDIGDKLYDLIKHYERLLEIIGEEENDTLEITLMRAIIKGTPLPEHHGRLIDADAIVYEKECVYLSDGSCTTESAPNISATPTIIEADRG